MEVDQTITSAIKKPKKQGTRIKKKRLTFQDEVNVTKSEEDQKLKGSTQSISAKSTNFLTFGFVFIKSFSQQGSDIVGVTYNSKNKKIVLADGKGFFSLNLLPNCPVKREMSFQKYQSNMARIITYSEKFNVYFVLQKDFAIKVFNKDYVEICSVENPGSGRITDISFNPVKDELTSSGIKGVKIWKFKEKNVPVQANPIPMYNYSLFRRFKSVSSIFTLKSFDNVLKYSTEYPHMGNSWCTNMDFDVIMQRYYCFSDNHFFCYDTNGNMILEIPNAHQSAIVSCVYSSEVHILLTSSKGSEIKSWNDYGCLLHVFQGHSKTVTKLLLHPSATYLFISGSLDGSVKLWSFDTMDVFYSLSLFQEGILWIGTMEDTFLYCCSARNVHIYDLNLFTSFWTEVSSPISNLCLCSADGKSSRVVAMAVDNSLRIFSLHNGTKLCTVLPPPHPSLLQPVLSFAYNRASGTIYFLLTHWDIWIYTARTDPACRAAMWSTRELQQHLHRKHPLASASYVIPDQQGMIYMSRTLKRGNSCVQKNDYFQHMRDRNFRTTARCECLCSLSSPLCYLIDEGMVYADNQEFLVLGMQDGRILFLHTSIQNLVYYEMTAYKDPVIHLRHDMAHRQLIIMCQKPNCKLVHFRSLPALELVFQVDASNDTMVFTRLDSSLFVGLTSGTVDVLSILSEDDKIAFSENDVNNNGESEQKYTNSCSENYHNGPVVAVDSCKNLSIFLSCGSDSVIKIWNIQKNLLAEITLDNTLSTACFLNSSGDILLAFKSDLYILSHSKALGLLKTNIDAATVPETESFIFESEPLDQEKNDVSESTEMASYLVPYKGYVFTEDFTSELLVLPKKKENQPWRLSLAPSKVYCSPCASETSLKMFDFLLQPGNPNVEEQDKAKMSEKMIVTEDMKYVLGPKSAAPPDREIPFFGISPCSSVVQEQPRTKIQPKEQTAEVESGISFVEPLKEALSKEEHQIYEEMSPEVPEIMPEGAQYLDEKQTLEPVSYIDHPLCDELSISSGAQEHTQAESYITRKRKEKHPSGEKLFKNVKSPFEKRSASSDMAEVRKITKVSENYGPMKHLPKKLIRTERLGLKKMRTPKHVKKKSVAKSAIRTRDLTFASYPPQPISVAEKVFPSLGTEGLRPAEKRPPSRKKTDQHRNEDYESPYEKDIIRVVAWRRKQNELIQQAEERRLMLQLKKRPCSRNRCFTPNNSQQYKNLQSSEYFPETLFSWMKPYKQHHSRPYTVMEETTINLPRDFPYRLAWGTPTTEDLDIKLYHPKMKLNMQHRISSLLAEKSLQPTKSIPDKGRFILVSDPISVPSTPSLSPLENKLLSVRFPKQKEKILRSLLLDGQEPC